jgi:hypothetical protein
MRVNLREGSIHTRRRFSTPEGTSYGLLDTRPEAIFDKITHLTKYITGDKLAS